MDIPCPLAGRSRAATAY